MTSQIPLSCDVVCNRILFCGKINIIQCSTRLKPVITWEHKRMCVKMIIRKPNNTSKIVLLYTAQPRRDFPEHHQLNFVNYVFPRMVATISDLIMTMITVKEMKKNKMGKIEPFEKAVLIVVSQLKTFFTPRALQGAQTFLNKTGVTHCGRVAHICVSKLTIIGSDNGLSPGRRQAIIWTNDGILCSWPSGTKFSETLIEIRIFLFKKMHLKMSFAKWWQFCLGPNALKRRSFDPC